MRDGESCLNTVADSAAAAQRRTRHRLHAPKLLKALAGKRNVLVTAHPHPDLEAITAEAYAADAAAERQWEAQEAQRHAESGMGCCNDGSER